MRKRAATGVSVNSAPFRPLFEMICSVGRRTVRVRSATWNSPQVRLIRTLSVAGFPPHRLVEIHKILVCRRKAPFSRHHDSARRWHPDCTPFSHLGAAVTGRPARPRTTRPSRALSCRTARKFGRVCGSTQVEAQRRARDTWTCSKRKLSGRMRGRREFGAGLGRHSAGPCRD